MLLVEMKKPDQAVVYLKRAADGMPRHARVRYNLSILLQQLGKNNQAESILKEALAIEPNNPEYLYALAVYYIQRMRFEEARPYAEKMTDIPEAQSSGRQLLQVINQN
jgi:Tfp pilus assembly protein PilF